MLLSNFYKGLTYRLIYVKEIILDWNGFFGPQQQDNCNY